MALALVLREFFMDRGQGFGTEGILTVSRKADSGSGPWFFCEPNFGTQTQAHGLGGPNKSKLRLRLKLRLFLRLQIPDRGNSMPKITAGLRSQPIAESQKMYERQQNSVFVYQSWKLVSRIPSKHLREQKSFCQFFRPCFVMERIRKLFHISMWRYQWTLSAIPKNFTLTCELLPITGKAR